MSRFAHIEDPAAPAAAAFSVRMAEDDDVPGKGGDDGGDGGSETGVVTQTKPKTKKPAMYKVIMLNDDYTPMEFVILVLERFFSKNEEEARAVAQAGMGGTVRL